MLHSLVTHHIALDAVVPGEEKALVYGTLDVRKVTRHFTKQHAVTLEHGSQTIHAVSLPSYIMLCHTEVSVCLRSNVTSSHHKEDLYSVS